MIDWDYERSRCWFPGSSEATPADLPAEERPRNEHEAARGVGVPSVGRWDLSHLFDGGYQMAVKKLQAMSVQDGEPFIVNGITCVIDGKKVMPLDHYEKSRGRPRPLCAICDTDHVVRICPECSERLRESFQSRTRESAVDELVRQIGERFRTFGGGQDSNTNPIAHALKDSALVFAAGVDVRAVVEFVLSQEDEQPSSVGAVDPQDGSTPV